MVKHLIPPLVASDNSREATYFYSLQTLTGTHSMPYTGNERTHGKKKQKTEGKGNLNQASQPGSSSALERRYSREASQVTGQCALCVGIMPLSGKTGFIATCHCFSPYRPWAVTSPPYWCWLQVRAGGGGPRTAPPLLPPSPSP